MNIIAKRKIMKISGAIIVVSLILIGIITFSSDPTKSGSDSHTQRTSTDLEDKEILKENWKEVLYDIGEWNKNDGETTTKKFTIKAEKWRVKWEKKKTTQLAIQVFMSDGEPFGEIFTAEFNDTEGVLDFEGKGTYYIHFGGGINPSAGVWEIKVEELEED